jgi:hemoglobin-like flavoprotein
MGDADIVFQSYGRACNNPEFFETFYNKFMSKSPEIRAMFVNTNMAAQRGLLRGGVMWLIMHARGMSDSKIRALGESHSKKRMNINPMFYSFWLDALLETLAIFDAEFTQDLDRTWRNTLRPGIEIIQSMYDM